jgi:hypothetical protein
MANDRSGNGRLLIFHDARARLSSEALSSEPRPASSLLETFRITFEDFVA